ncbi:hypothetical protein D3C86_1692790 [compost metagenome]
MNYNVGNADVLKHDDHPWRYVGGPLLCHQLTSVYWIVYLTTRPITSTRSDTQRVPRRHRAGKTQLTRFPTALVVQVEKKNPQAAEHLVVRPVWRE